MKVEGRPMFTILSDDECFSILNNNFKELKVNDVIDLVYEGKRSAAIVVDIEQRRRQFTALPLTEENVEKVMSAVQSIGTSPWYSYHSSLITVVLPDTADKQRPMWNKIPRS
jgi:hypothetical protein